MPWDRLIGSDDYGYALDGSFFSVTNQTVGTGMVWVAAQTAFSDTTPNIYIQNGEPKAGKVIALRHLKFITTAAATLATSIQYVFKLDNAFRTLTTDHTSSNLTGGGASGHQVAVNAMNGAVGGVIPAIPMNFQINVQDSLTASVISASSANARVVARGTLGGLNVAGDEIHIVFGQNYSAGASPALTAAEASGQPGRRVSCDNPVVIPPGWCLTGYVWMPSSTASFNPEFTLGMRAA